MVKQTRQFVESIIPYSLIKHDYLEKKRLMHI